MGRWAADGRNIDYNVEIADFQSTNMVPIQFQETLRTQGIVSSLSAVLIGANVSNPATNFTDVRGYDKVGINVYMTAGTGMSIKIETSFDGTSYFSEKTIYDGTAIVYAEVIEVPAPFIRLSIKNKDAAPKTTSAQLFIKS